MVCAKCEKKLGKVIVPDKWKEGASNTNESGGRKINENKLLSKKNRWTPYGNTKCVICKQQVHQDAKYCHTCAYSKGKELAPCMCNVREASAGHEAV
uniref:Cysteine-rich PDZ-binding protein n=1 Tax=Oryza barthii TaxID=65489 RepID=A0A0D3GX41_9ORYZ